MSYQTPKGRLGLFLVFSALLPAQQQKPLDAPQPQPKDNRLEENEAVKNTAASIDVKSYLIGPEDVLMIRVYREPDLTGQVVVRPDGDITLPLVRDVRAAGLTPVQLQTNLAESLSKYINKPDVLVSVLAVRSKKYMISGEVSRPGTYPLVTPTTVLEAIVSAGGLKEFAKEKGIVIMRGTQRLKFNYKDVIKGKNMAQNVLLENGDHVVVP